MRYKSILLAIILISMLVPGILSADEYHGLNMSAQTEKYETQKSPVTLHKILGWGSLGMMAASIVTGFVIPETGHCALSEVATGLAVATCVDGFYEYGGLINFRNGDWRINSHVVLGTFATAGFISTLALGEDKSHVLPGVVSSVTFSVATVVLYF